MAVKERPERATQDYRRFRCPDCTKVSRLPRLKHLMSAVAPRRLAGTLVALAFVLQASFAIPLALRMAADTTWWSKFGTELCSNGLRDAAGQHQNPAAPLLPHGHDHCLICHGSTAPVTTLTTALVVLMALSSASAVALASQYSLSWLRGRLGPYQSRAPPAVV